MDAGHFLSRSGQTAPFDSAADGYSRSEGCGIVVLKRLSDAILDNDRILGTIRAIEVNQSYENKSITRTHAPTQAALIRRLLSNAGVLPEQLDVVEAHAAGTRLGDASEVEALRSVFSEAARQDPLYISSVKASIGHLEAASGVASLAKALLMMKHDLIPRQPRIRRLSPPIEALLSSSLVIPANASIIWPPRSDAKPRHALVNNYGAAGSNVSLLLEEHVDPQISNSQPTGTAISTLVFGMSASTERALEELREKYVAWLTTLPSHVSLLDICYSSTARRRKRDYRLSFPFSGDERAGFIRSLQDCRITRVQSGKPEVVFVYPGHGCQYPGMGKILYETCNTFKEEIDRYDILIVREGFPSFKSYLIDGIEVPLEDAAIIEQTALLSYQLALSALWVSWGVSPAAVVGHRSVNSTFCMSFWLTFSPSLGEYASLVTSGVISSEDALTLIARRAHLVHKHCIPHETGMMAVPLPRDILELELKSEPSFSEVVIACFNNQTRHTVAGPISQLKALKRRLDTIYGDQCRLLPSLYGYHSPAMRPMIEEFKRFTADIALQRPTCSFASTVKGSIFRAGEPLATDHLVQQCIGQVRFFDAVKSLTAALDNVETQICWMEISPRRTTLPLIRRMDLPSHSAMYIDSIDCRIDPWVSISAGLSSLYTTKIELDWRLVFSSLGRPKCVPLPAYPFQTRSFWVPYREPSLAGFSKEDRPEGPSRDQATESTRSSPEYGRQSSSRFEHRSTILLATAHVVRYSRGHVVANIPLAPASIFLECVLSSLLAAHEEAASSPPTYSSVRHLEFVRPLVFQEDSPPTATYLHLDRIDDESSEFTICPWSEKEEGGNIVYARGQCQIRRDAGTLGDVSALEVVKNRIKLLQPAPGRYIDIFTAATIYEVIFPRVVHYAKFFRALDCMVISEDRLEAHAILKLPVSLDKSESSLGTSIHPVYLDAMVHFSGFMVNLRAEDGDLFVCSGIGELDVLPSALATCSDDSRPVFQAYTILSSLTRDAFLADTLVFTSDPPRIVAKLKNIQFKRVRRCVLTSRRDGAHDLPDTPLSSLSRSSSVCPSVAEESASTVSLKQILESALLLPEGCLENHSRIDTLGLDSLTSIEVLHVFRKTYGACVPHDFFEDCSTVGEAEMALDRLIQPRTLGRGSPRDTCLQHLRSTTSARPAVCFIHDGTGMIRPYQSLPDIERDVWAIEDPYMGTTGWDTIEKMASFYAGVLTETPFLHGLILAGVSPFVEGHDWEADRRSRILVWRACGIRSNQSPEASWRRCRRSPAARFPSPFRRSDPLKRRYRVHCSTDDSFDDPGSYTSITTSKACRYGIAV